MLKTSNKSKLNVDITNFHELWLTSKSTILLPKGSNLNTQSMYQSSNSTILYKFRFISLIAPFLLSNLRLDNVSTNPSTRGKSTILLKQSYLLMTWFYYLKYSHNTTRGADKGGIKFVFVPTRYKKYTLTKAPMAHKTKSKEQFVFRFFNFYVQVRTRLQSTLIKPSFNYNLLLMLLIRTTFPVFETNLLLLKYHSILVTLKCGGFFRF